MMIGGWTTPRLARWFATLFQGLATTTVVFRGFPRGFFYFQLLITFPACFTAILVTEQLPSGSVPSFEGSLFLRYATDPLLITAASLFVFFVYVFRFHGRRIGSLKRTSLVASIYFLVALSISWLYVTAFMNPALLVSGARPEPRYPLTSKVSLLSVGEGVPSSLLVIQFMCLILMLVMVRKNVTTQRAGAVVIVFTSAVLTTYSLLSQGQRASDIVLALLAATVLTNLAIVVAFSFRSERASYGRCMADALAAFVSFVLLVWFYAPEHPALILGSMALVVCVVTPVLIIEDWVHPRRTDVRSFRA